MMTYSPVFCAATKLKLREERRKLQNCSLWFEPHSLSWVGTRVGWTAYITSLLQRNYQEGIREPK